MNPPLYLRILWRIPILKRHVKDEWEWLRQVAPLTTQEIVDEAWAQIHAMTVEAAVPSMLARQFVTVPYYRSHEGHNVGIEKDAYGYEGRYCFTCGEFVIL